uniref:Carbohydrate-binding domain-containing protein n=1 Tax=Tetradesmus obliquus TaxID=3088 RepID=A0A383VZY3_TETOB|eukprot:jgi/Sobl393_1/15124/SZX70344.1
MLCAQAQQEEVPLPYGQLHSKPAPPGYVARKCTTAAGSPVIDGQLDDACWQAADWTSEFVDIVGPQWGQPWFSTRVKMAWDDAALYIAAALEEPRAFAIQTLHDSIIFKDNDFEVFIDPDGDNWMYYELEVNALGKVWDLFLVRPYRNGGPPVMNWETVAPAEPTETAGPTGWQPLSLGVAVQGAVNAAEGSQGWSVELALPWSLLKQAAQRATPPKAGDQWRINFSRVQWNVTWDEQLQTYVKEPADQPGYNWVWAPQWQVQMHQPETWGYLQFSDAYAELHTLGSSNSDSSSGGGDSKARSCADEFVADPTWPARALLMDVYHSQTQCWQEKGRFCSSLAEMGIDCQQPVGDALQVHITPFSFVASTTVPAQGQAEPCDSSSSSSSGSSSSGSSSSGSSNHIMVLVDQLGRLAQFPVDAQGRAVPGAAYSPFDGNSQWLPDEQSRRTLCVGRAAAAAETT